MTVDSVRWTWTVVVALSLPPALLLLMARCSKRSEKTRIKRDNNKNGSEKGRNSSSVQHSIDSIVMRTSRPRTRARCKGRDTRTATRCSRASVPAGASIAAAVCLLMSLANHVAAFCGAECFMTVRGLTALREFGSHRSLGAGQSRAASSYLAGKVVWITGASSGLGEQLAISAAVGGAEGIILSGRREDALERVRQACEDSRPETSTARSGGVRVLPFDMGDLEFVEKEAAKRAMGEFGRVDTLVLNAGISTRSSVEDTSLDVDKRVMAVNYFGAVGLAKGLLAARAPPPPSAADAGTPATKRDIDFVVVNSVQGRFGMAFRSSYAASKHALVGFFDCLRAEQAHRGVGVLSVFPGYVRTSLSVNALTGDGTQHARMDATTAAGRDPREVADEIWQAAARGREELVIAEPKVKLAVLLRALAPRVLFGIMAKRALKEEGGDQ